MTAPGQLTTRFVYDIAGRMTHRILPDGSRLVVQQDTEGRKTSEARYAGDDAANAAALSSTRYQYDEASRLVRVDDDLGMRSRMEYTALGEVARLTNGLGAATQFAYDDNGLLVLRTQAANSADASTIRLDHDSHGEATAITDANGVRTERRFDDFGRKVFEASADRGVMLYLYDGASRIVARIDENGVTTRYSYDHAGRLVALGGKMFYNSVTGKRIESDGKQIDLKDVFGDGSWGSGGWMDEYNRLTTKNEKISWLNERMDALGLGTLMYCDVGEANRRRTKNLSGLRQQDYPGTILATPAP